MSNALSELFASAITSDSVTHVVTGVVQELRTTTNLNGTSLTPVLSVDEVREIKGFWNSDPIMNQVIATAIGRMASVICDALEIDIASIPPQLVIEALDSTEEIHEEVLESVRRLINDDTQPDEEAVEDLLHRAAYRLEKELRGETYNMAPGSSTLQ